MDREKIIKAVEEAFDLVHSDFIGTDDFNEKEWEQNKTDALELLKEREAKVPSIMQDVDGIWATCPTCGNKLRAILAMEMDTYFPKYCQECGQAVKWDA